MYCPSCGQQQISNETKFCSRCGLPLGLVGEVVVNGGYLPRLSELETKKKPLLSRRNGLAFSLLWALFFVFLMTPLWGILDIDKLAGASAIIGIFGGLLWMVSSLVFLKRDVPKFNQFHAGYSPSQGQFGNPGQQAYPTLPSQREIPVQGFNAQGAGNWRDTKDLQPTSVTEGTTRLLDKDEL